MSDLMKEEMLTVKFKRGLRTDGAVEAVTIGQLGFGELRLTTAQAKSLARMLNNKFGPEESREGKS